MADDDREQYISHLEGQREAGMLAKDEMMRSIIEYDALAATKRMRIYSLISTIAAAVSAVASAIATFFAYVGVHHH